tara:strand:+ start:62 stop:511 length:450 start_codon:yes stop_codon:yes gene_type:complete
MRQDLDIKPTEITLADMINGRYISHFQTHIWTTDAVKHEKEFAKWVDATEKNELTFSMNLSPQLGTTQFFLDEKFDLICMNGSKTLIENDNGGLSSYNAPWKFSKLSEKGLPYWGITLDMLQEIREIHQALIDAVSNIKVNYPQLITKS